MTQQTPPADHANEGERLAVLSDGEIVARILEGDPPMYELIMRRYNRLLFRLARSIVREDDEARDVVQEAYVRAYYHLGQFRGPHGFRSWLARITINEAQARSRRRKTVLDSAERLVEFPSVPALEPERAAISDETLKLARHAIDRLPEEFRTVFMLRGVEQLSVAETASMLDVKPATVKTRFHRARILLQAALHRHVDDLARETFQFGGEQCDAIVAAVLDRIKRA